MEYNLNGFWEVIIGTAFFAVLAGLGYFYANRGEISDDTRTFR